MNETHLGHFFMARTMMDCKWERWDAPFRNERRLDAAAATAKSEIVLAGTLVTDIACIYMSRERTATRERLKGAGWTKST